MTLKNYWLTSLNVCRFLVSDWFVSSKPRKLGKADAVDFRKARYINFVSKSSEIGRFTKKSSAGKFSFLIKLQTITRYLNRVVLM